jgi:hypothetical protein
LAYFPLFTFAVTIMPIVLAWQCKSERSVS